MRINYSDVNNWSAFPATLSHDVDVFFACPTAWKARIGEHPLSSIHNPDFRHWTKYYITTRASVFENCANIFAPYYRQLDTAFALSKGAEAEKYFYDAPLRDITLAFDYYIKNLNQDRPFILAGHSQGSIMLRGILHNYMRAHPDIYRRMIAAYAIGVPFTQKDYAENPHTKAAANAEDIGVIISYNTEAPKVEGINPLAIPGAITINPVSWVTDSTRAPAESSLGSIHIQTDWTLKKLERFADAQINPARGTIICSTADPVQFGSPKESAACFPRGILHESDVVLYYYDLRANAVLRIKKYFLNHM